MWNAFTVRYFQFESSAFSKRSTYAVTVFLARYTQTRHIEGMWYKGVAYTPHYPILQILQCTYPISHNAPFGIEMCTFLLWMVYCRIWDRCIWGHVWLVYYPGACFTASHIFTQVPLLPEQSPASSASILLDKHVYTHVNMGTFHTKKMCIFNTQFIFVSLDCFEW